jgi:uncharacterized protein
MKSKQYIKKLLAEYQTSFQEIGVRKMGLFGSYVREQQHETSDIDILVDFEESAENFDNLMKLYDLLETIFKDEKIEIVTKNGLSPYIGPKILNEVEYV